MVHAPRIWSRKVDNNIIITHHDKNDMPSELNKINGNITFKVDEEVNKIMSFLESLITRTNESHLKVAVSKKIFIKRCK